MYGNIPKLNSKGSVSATNEVEINGKKVFIPKGVTLNIADLL